jgi:hypothetical protein
MEPMFIVDGVVVAAGAEKSNRSADALAAGFDASDGENMSPKPPKPPFVPVVGFGAAGGDFGTGSKNPPPPSGGIACDVAVFLAVVATPFPVPNPPVSPANGDEKEDVSGAC